MTTDEIVEDARTKIAAAINSLRLQIDGYVLLCGLLGQASLQAEMLIATKRCTPDDITSYFAYSCGTALAPDEPIKAPRVVVIDGNDSGTKH